MINLTKLTINKARTLLDDKKISALELTKLYLDRIDNLDSQVASFLSVNYENAIEQAKQADSDISQGNSNILTGIPMQIKDNICTKGIPTTCASNMLEGFIPPYNSHISEKLNNSGAILLGKGNSSFKTTKNPWDLTRVPGGSSGGPAASVAASEALFSIGSDTGGSIRQPASFCGVVGMKPTYGLVSRFGLIAFASSLDQIGPITNNVEDSAIVLSAIAGYDSRDSTSLKVDIPDYSSGLKSDLNGFNIGVPKEYFTLGIDPKIENNVREAIKTLEELGANVEEVSLPHTKYALSVYYIIAPSEASANLSRYDGVKYGYSDSKAESMWDALEATRQSGFGPEVKRRIFLGTYALSSGYYDAYYVKAQKVRTLIRQDFEDVFKKFDVLVTPTAPTTAFKMGDKIDDPVQMYLNDIFTIPANIAGIPGISVPSGLIDGLPVGLQFMSGSLQEKKLFQAAHAYEKATDWNTIKPDI